MLQTEVKLCSVDHTVKAYVFEDCTAMFLSSVGLKVCVFEDCTVILFEFNFQSPAVHSNPCC